MVAIPAEKGRYFFTLVLTRNQFGVAYGLFHGRHPLRMPVKGTRTERHFYSSDELVTAGRWRIVGHDERLLSLFPSEPESLSSSSEVLSRSCGGQRPSVRARPFLGGCVT